MWGGGGHQRPGSRGQVILKQVGCYHSDALLFKGLSPAVSHGSYSLGVHHTSRIHFPSFSATAVRKKICTFYSLSLFLSPSPPPHSLFLILLQSRNLYITHIHTLLTLLQGAAGLLGNQLSSSIGRSSEMGKVASLYKTLFSLSHPRSFCPSIHFLCCIGAEV